MPIDVAIVVVTYNSEIVINDLLDSVPDALSGLSASIVVVDNGSSDDTVESVERRTDQVHVIRSENSGYSAGINKGVASSPAAEAVLILNPDVILQPGSISAMMGALNDPKVGIVAPRINGVDGILTRTMRREPSIPRSVGLGFTRLALFSEPVSNLVDYATTTAVDWAVGAVLLVRKKCFDQLNGWDESFFLYSEETDFCLRAKDNNWLTIFEPSAIASHFAGASGRNGKTQAMQVLNQVRLYNRRHGTAASWLFYGLAVVAESSRVARLRPNSTVALRALVSPRQRPVELGLANRLLPTDYRE